MISTEQFASVVVAGVGALLFWANPRRKVNRAVFASSASVATWLACSHMANVDSDRGLYWVRWINATGALVPLGLWMVKESIIGTFEFRNPKWLFRNAFWFIGAIALFALPFTHFFIPATSTSEHRLYGFGHRLYHAGIIFAYLWLVWSSL